MGRRNVRSNIRSTVARAGLWILNTILQDVVLRLLRAAVVPILVAILGLGGFLHALADTADRTDSLNPKPDSRRAAVRSLDWPPEDPKRPQGSKPDRPPAPYTTRQLRCTDQQGHSGTFGLVVFSRAFSWSLSSDEEVQLNASEADFRAQLASPGMARFLQAPTVIALGMASCEGYPEHREREIERAGKRARQLLAWIEAVRHPRDDHREHVPLQALNLGVYAKPCRTEETWDQRRIVLLALYETDPELSLRDCLQDALHDEPDLRALATDYEPGLGPNQPFFLGNR